MSRRISPSENAETLPDIVDADWSEPDEQEEGLRRQADDAEKQILDGLEIDTHNHEYYAYVYKKVNGRKEYCEQVGIEVFPLQERLRTKWRGGVFEVIVFKDGKIWKNKTYRIASQPVEDAVLTRPTQRNDGQMSEIAQMLRQQSELIASLQNSSRADPMEEMTRTLTMMKMMKDVFGGNQDDPTKAILKGVELVERLRGDGDNDGEKNIYSLIESVVRSPMTERLLAQSPQPPRPVQPPAQVTPNVSARPAPAMLAMLPEPLQAQIANQVAYWLDRARRNKDPVLYAELAFDTYEEDFIRNILFNEQNQEILEYFAPEIKTAPALKAWFAELFDALTTLLTMAPNDDVLSGDNQSGESDAFEQRNATAATAHHNSERSGGRAGNAPIDDNADKARREVGGGTSASVAPNPTIAAKGSNRGNPRAE